MPYKKRPTYIIDNMQDKVSEKAIWEGSIPSEDGNTQFSPFPQSQPQIMFCYKCKNVIPANSKYCPFCQIELYTKCPKCGAKYSSQYPACNQCGTNRLEYLKAQKIEQERIEARKREEAERQEKEKYERKKEQIMNTQEYQSTYSILEEALESFGRKDIIKCIMKIVLLLSALLVSWLICDDSWLDSVNVGIAVVIVVLWALLQLGLIVGIVLSIGQLGDIETREQYIWRYIGKKEYDYNKDMLEFVVKQFRDSSLFTSDILEKLSRWCVDAYEEKRKK